MPSEDTSNTKPGPTCRCGYGLDHPLVIAEAKYSLFHFSLGLFMGMSAGTPKAVLYRCNRCGQVIKASTDLDVRRAHRNS